MESWTKVERRKVQKITLLNTTFAIPSNDELLAAYDYSKSSTTIIHRKIVHIDGANQLRDTSVGIMKTIELDAASAFLSHNKIKDTDGNYKVFINGARAVPDALQAVIEFLNPLRLPFPESYTSKQNVRVLGNWSIFQVAQVYQAAALLELKVPLSIDFARSKLYEYIAEEASIRPEVIVEIWRCTNEYEDAKLRDETANSAFNHVKKAEAPQVSGPVHKAFVKAFSALPALLQAYHGHRSRYLSYVANRADQKARKEKMAAKRAKSQAETEEAFHADVANRRGVSTITRDF